MKTFHNYALQLVWLHAGISAVHGIAHGIIPVENSLLDWLYILSVIVAAPFVALWLLRGQPKWGWGLLALSMLGALLFGFVKHYVLVSPDHVGHLPHEDGHLLFQITAGLLLVIEGLGALLGLSQP